MNNQSDWQIYTKSSKGWGEELARASILHDNSNPPLLILNSTRTDGITRALIPLANLGAPARKFQLFASLYVCSATIPQQPLEWIALLEGDSPKQTSFFRILQKRPKFERREHTQSWDFDQHDFDRVWSRLYFAFQIRANAVPITAFALIQSSSAKAVTQALDNEKTEITSKENAKAIFRSLDDRKANASSKVNAKTFVDDGRRLARDGRPEAALGKFEQALALDPDSVDALHGAGASNRRIGALDKAKKFLLRAINLKPRATSYVELGLIHEAEGDMSAARDCFEKSVYHAPDNPEPNLLLARARYSLGDHEGALTACEHALRIAPNHFKALTYRRWLFQDPKRSPVAQPDVVFLRPQQLQDRELLANSVGLIGDVFDASAQDWSFSLRSVKAETVLTIQNNFPERAELNNLIRHLGKRVGYVSTTSASGNVLWRTELLHAVMETEAKNVQFDRIADIARVKLHGRSIGNKSTSLAPVKSLGEVWLVSSSGIKLFGGVEQFLRSLVPLYREQGFTPIIVGLLEKETEPTEGEIDGIHFINLTRSIDAVRRLALQRDPVLCHGTTGVGYELAAALSGLQCRLIYGSHFWRDMFYGSGGFENIDLSGVPRAEFADLCAALDQPYVNSVYTRDVLSSHFGIAQPVMYSLPFDVEHRLTARQPGQYALLMNGRPEKGLNHVIEMAARLTSIHFVVVAAQVSRQRVEEQVNSAGVKNIEIIDWQEDVAPLYQGALAVLVPSYSFVETFSRTVIEAQRYAIPVIGSDRGNLPVLLKKSGVALPRKIDAWCDELQRLATDRGYWETRSTAARANSDRYLFADQADRLKRIVCSARQRIAVGVGSGIGNVIQTTPAIRRLSEHFSAPVDVLLRADVADSAELLQGAPWISSIISRSDIFQSIRYDTVVLLDAFGDLIPELNADVVHITRQHFSFSMMRHMHEAQFNLMCVRELLGVPFEQSDIGRYFVGSFARGQVKPRRIGLHGGSKGGIWRAKQWPYFGELADHLTSRGYEVLSFGSRDEYIEGTIDATGTSLAVSIETLATCSYVVANDSGLMHVADALGIPLTAIFGPSSTVKNRPLSASSRVIAVEKDCAPCQFDKEKLARCYCISEISCDRVSDLVLAELSNLLN